MQSVGLGRDEFDDLPKSVQGKIIADQIMPSEYNTMTSERTINISAVRIGLITGISSLCALPLHIIAVNDHCFRGLFVAMGEGVVWELGKWGKAFGKRFLGGDRTLDLRPPLLPLLRVFGGWLDPEMRCPPPKTRKSAQAEASGLPISEYFEAKRPKAFPGCTGVPAGESMHLEFLKGHLRAVATGVTSAVPAAINIAGPEAVTTVDQIADVPTGSDRAAIRRVVLLRLVFIPLAAA